MARYSPSCEKDSAFTVVLGENGSDGAHARCWTGWVHELCARESANGEPLLEIYKTDDRVCASGSEVSGPQRQDNCEREAFAGTYFPRGSSARA